MRRGGPTSHLPNKGACKDLLHNITECNRGGSRLHSACHIKMPTNSRELLRVAINLFLFQRTPGLSLLLARAEGWSSSREATGLWGRRRDWYVTRKQLYNYQCRYFYQGLLMYPFAAILIVVSKYAQNTYAPSDGKWKGRHIAKCHLNGILMEFSQITF